MKRLSKSQVQSELLRAKDIYTSGDVDASIEKIDEILRLNPDSVEALVGKGTMLYALDRRFEALDTFTQVIRYEPNSRDALYWIAQIGIGIGIGRAPEAEAAAFRLTKLEPRDDRAHFLLSVAQSQSGKWMDAVESIDRALAVKPNDLNYIMGRAQMLVKLHRYSMAIRGYRKALTIKRAPQIIRELAEVLLDEGHPADALSLLQELAADGTADAPLQILLARAHSETGQAQEADSRWSAARTNSKTELEYIKARARHEIASGEIEKAEELLREGLRIDPAATYLFAMLAPIVQFSGGDIDQIGAMEQEIARDSHSPWVRQNLSYALGKAYHDLEDYGKAMSFFDEANRLRAELTPNGMQFNAVEWKARIDLQIQSFSGDRIKELKKEGLDSDIPILVMGMIRSGTTLTEQILSCHREIAAGGEVSFWVDNSYLVANPLRGTFDPARAQKLGAEYLGILETSRLGKRHVIDKNPLNVLIAATLHCILPNARTLHLKRDAVDNLLSIWMTPLTTGLQFISTKKDLVYAYREYLRLADHLQSVLPPDRFRTFAYEDLTSRPSDEIGSMLGFLGLEGDESCLHPENNRRSVKTPSMYQVRRPINTDSQERWKPYQPWLEEFAELTGQ